MVDIWLVAVGDLMFGEDHLTIGRGVGSLIRRKGVEYLFSGVKSALVAGDIVFGNLEAVISDSGFDRKTLNSVAMRADPQSAEGLTFAGFNVLSLANNHMLDHGPEALTETVSALTSRGIQYIGPWKHDLDSSRDPLLIVQKGIKMAFFGYCLIPGCADSGIDIQDRICTKVREAKSEANVVAVSLHWGDEYMDLPSPSQIELAHRIIDSGADIILGHHPHVVQGVEKYHQGLIAYSLGNFIFGLNYLEMTRMGVILKCKLSESGIVDFELIPTRMDFELRPIVLEGREKEEALAGLRWHSLEPKKGDSARDGTTVSEYDLQIKRRRKTVRGMMIMHFLRNIPRYPPNYTIQIAGDFLRKRLVRVRQ